METIKEQIETIKNNLFINDMAWRERADQNEKLAHKIRENIDSVEDRQFIVDTLDFLDSHNL